jgi:hypothetical protein
MSVTLEIEPARFSGQVSQPAQDLACGRWEAWASVKQCSGCRRSSRRDASKSAQGNSPSLRPLAFIVRFVSARAIWRDRLNQRFAAHDFRNRSPRGTQTSPANPIAEIVLVVNASERLQKRLAAHTVSSEKDYLSVNRPRYRPSKRFFERVNHRFLIFVCARRKQHAQLPQEIVLSVTQGQGMRAFGLPVLHFFGELTLYPHYRRVVVLWQTAPTPWRTECG